MLMRFFKQYIGAISYSKNILVNKQVGMELILGMVIGVVISFLAFYLTKRMSLDEEGIALQREQRREALVACNKRLQEQMTEQLQLLQHINSHVDHRSWYVHGCVSFSLLHSFLFCLGLGTGISSWFSVKIET